MVDYELQFTPDDIARWFQAARGFDEKKKLDFSVTTAHAFLSPMYSLMGGAQFFYDTFQNNTLLLASSAQRDKFKDIREISLGLEDCLASLTQRELRQPDLPRGIIDRLAERTYNTLSNFVNCLPVAEQMVKSDELSPIQAEHLGRFFATARIIVYTLNRHLAPAFQTDRFYLHEDLQSFSVQTLDIFRQNNVWLPIGDFDRIITSADYLAYAIAPLVWNALQHAFNPDNDILGRISTVNFSKSVRISRSPDVDIAANLTEGRAGDGRYGVIVSDNGFGIMPHVLPHIFTMGASSKPYDGTQHGVGLWGVRNFVEEHGGSIDVKTELGKGTQFKFTIPYSRMEHSVYVQS